MDDIYHLGHDHMLRIIEEDGEPVTAIVYHPAKDNPEILCSVMGPLEKGQWRVSNPDPITVIPSFVCECGDHGLVTKGKWERVEKINGIETIFTEDHLIY